MKKSILTPFLFIGSLASASCKGTSENKATTGTDAIQMEKSQSGTIHLTHTEFLKKAADYENHSEEWKYLGDKPAIVDFHANWCGPCKMITPILEELSKEYTGKIYIYKVDVDKKPELAKASDIQSIPTLWLVPMKGEPQVSTGVSSKEQLKGYTDEVLLKP